MCHNRSTFGGHPLRLAELLLYALLVSGFIVGFIFKFLSFRSDRAHLNRRASRSMDRRL
jgi:hypothetical protein